MQLTGSPPPRRPSGYQDLAYFTYVILPCDFALDCALCGLDSHAELLDEEITIHHLHQLSSLAIADS